MAEISGPWATTPPTFGEDQWSTMFGAILPNGVFSDPQGLELLPYADSSGMQVKLRAGIGYVAGQYYQNTAEKLVAIRNGDTQPRIDTVVLTRNAASNTILSGVVEGTPAATAPIAATLTAQQIPLAHVTVAANRTTSIAPAESIDWRPFMPRYSRPAQFLAAAPAVPRLGDWLTMQDAPYFYSSTGWTPIQVVEDSQWAACTLASGWGRYTGGGGYPVQPEARLLNGVVYLRGMIYKVASGVARTTYAPVVTLPSSCFPGKTHRWAVAASWQADILDFFVQTDGTVTVITGASTWPAGQGAAVALDTSFALEP